MQDGCYECSSCHLLFDRDNEPLEYVSKYISVFACGYICAKCSYEGITFDNLHEQRYKQHIPDFFKEGKHKEMEKSEPKEIDTEVDTEWMNAVVNSEALENSVLTISDKGLNWVSRDEINN